MNEEVYIHKFGGGIKVKALFNNETKKMKIVWIGKPNRNIVLEYLSWKDTVFKMVTKNHQIRLVDVTLGNDGINGIQNIYENGKFMGQEAWPDLVDHVGNGDCK